MRVGVTRGWVLHEGLHCTRTGITRGWELREGSRCVKTHRAGARVLHVGGCRCRLARGHALHEGVRRPRLLSPLPPQLSIRCGNHRFKVFAEGQPLCNFSHRLPPGPHVDTLEVQGDVVLSYVHF